MNAELIIKIFLLILSVKDADFGIEFVGVSIQDLIIIDIECEVSQILFNI